MGSSNGRTKRNIEDDGRRQRRQTGAQTDRQTMQMHELIRRMFMGMKDPGGSGLHGSVENNVWDGHMPTRGPRHQRIKSAYIDADAVNHFGDVGSAWPYDPQGASDYRYGPGDDRGRFISARSEPRWNDFGWDGGLRSRPAEWPGGYHTDKDGGSWPSGRGRPGTTI